MLVAFLDSTNTPERTGWFALGGVLIQDSSLLLLEERFCKTLESAGVPIGDDALDAEVKWSPRRGNWIRENLKPEGREELYRAVLRIGFDVGCRLVGAILNWGGMTNKKTGRRYTDDQARDLAYTLVLERIQAHADQKNETALIVCDCESDPQKTKDGVRRSGNLISAGSPYVSFGRIYKHVWPVDSRDHAGIQIADLCMGILGCLATGKARFARNYWDLLQGKFIARNGSRPQDWGLAVLPTPLRKRFLKEWDPYGRERS